MQVFVLGTYQFLLRTTAYIPSSYNWFRDILEFTHLYRFFNSIDGGGGWLQDYANQGVLTRSYNPDEETLESFVAG
jgi:hypothetical protein